jgi:hypothetical protein
VANVVVEVEVWVVDPHRSAELQGNRSNPLPVARDLVHLAGDQPDDIVVGRWGVGEDARPGDVHVGGSVLEVEELRIQGLQTLHGGSLSTSLDRSASTNSPDPGDMRKHAHGSPAPQPMSWVRQWKGGSA